MSDWPEISGALKRCSGNVFDGGGCRLSPVVAQQVGGDAKEVTACGDFAIAVEGRGSVGGEKADVALLQEVVGQGGVAGVRGEVGPEGAGRPLVKGGEGVAIHVRPGGRRRPGDLGAPA